MPGENQQEEFSPLWFLSCVHYGQYWSPNAPSSCDSATTTQLLHSDVTPSKFFCVYHCNRGLSQEIRTDMEGVGDSVGIFHGRWSGTQWMDSPNIEYRCWVLPLGPLGRVHWVVLLDYSINRPTKYYAKWNMGTKGHVLCDFVFSVNSPERAKSMKTESRSVISGYLGLQWQEMMTKMSRIFWGWWKCPTAVCGWGYIIWQVQ